MRVLIDTCIVIDALQSREPFCVAAQKIFIAAASAFSSSQNLAWTSAIAGQAPNAYRE